MRIMCPDNLCRQKSDSLVLQISVMERGKVWGYRIMKKILLNYELWNITGKRGSIREKKNFEMGASLKFNELGLLIKSGNRST